MTVTTPFCSHCGYDFVRLNNPSDQWCDSCGADLFRSVADGDGPSNPPSVPNVTDATGGVASASWTPAPNFDTYNIRWRVNGQIVAVRYGVTTPDTYTAQIGDEVCASLQGVTDGIGSDWSAFDCVTLA